VSRREVRYSMMTAVLFLSLAKGKKGNKLPTPGGHVLLQSASASGAGEERGARTLDHRSASGLMCHCQIGTPMAWRKKKKGRAMPIYSYYNLFFLPRIDEERSLKWVRARRAAKRTKRYSGNSSHREEKKRNTMGFVIWYAGLSETGGKG